jgi:IS5 family transposase
LVTHVSVPNRETKSAERRKLEKQRCEGRISVLKRRHGLNRCRYKGDQGMRRWVGMGVIGDAFVAGAPAVNIRKRLLDYSSADFERRRVR